MKHKGYTARVEFDAEDGILVGHIVGIDDVIGFHADTVRDLEAAFVEAVDDYLATCAAIGKSPEKAYSGKFMLRIDPEIHKRAARLAETKGVSLNQWAEEAIASATG